MSGAIKYQTEVLVIGGGLAGITAAVDLLDHDRKVLILERDQPDELGGLAKKSFGGVMLVGTPQQKRTGIADTPELALQDWHATAEFAPEDVWPQKWAEVYVNQSIELIYDWLTQRQIEFLPLVNWPERGLFKPGNSVPRWHIIWGTGHVMMENIIKHLNQHPKRQNLRIEFGHRVESLTLSGGKVSGCRGHLEQESTEFECEAEQVVVASGGICGGDLGMVRQHWYKPWGSPPAKLLNGAHRFGDGTLHQAVGQINGNLTHLDKQFHYAAGIHHPNPDIPNRGLSLVPPRSALWMNATGRRIGPVPLMGYTDTRYLVERICQQPGQFSWQILNWKIAIKELAVSGSEFMTAFRHRKKLKMVKEILLGNTELVNRLLNECQDLIKAYSIEELADKMNQLQGDNAVDARVLREEITRYDSQIDRGKAFHNDYQLRRIANFREYRGDKLRTCNFQKIDDPKAMPLIAIREFILSRKSLGGIQTDLNCRVLDQQGQAIPGLYAVGEAAGFGGGGIHGKSALEGSFLGSCILTGRIAAKTIAKKS